MQQIHVDGTYNVRHIGGPQPWLVRAASLDSLTAVGAETLTALGVSRVIDLREPDEAVQAQRHIPVRPVAIYGCTPPLTGRLEDVYEDLLRTRGAALTEAVDAIANAPAGAVVHCTAGKDRTGLVVALALLTAGATADEVVADYVRSGADVRAQREPVARRIAATSSPGDADQTMRLHLDSPAEAMRHALSVIDEFGGAEAYLRSHGLSTSALTRLHAHGEGGEK